MPEPTPGVRPQVALLIALGVAAVSLLLTRWWLGQGHAVPRPSWLGITVQGLLAVAVLRYGLEVRRYQRGRATAPLNPLRAARTAGLAQAAAICGAILAGAWAGPLLAIIRELDFADYAMVALRLLVALLTAILISVLGFRVQSWCRVHPPSDDGQTPGALAH